MPLGGLLVSMREAKNSGFSSRCTADLHPDRRAFRGETTRNGDCRQPQHIKWPGVVEHMIRERLAQVNRMLEDITGEMTKPIGNLRSAMKAIIGKRPAISKIIEENIMLMEDRLQFFRQFQEAEGIKNYQ